MRSTCVSRAAGFLVALVLVGSSLPVTVTVADAAACGDVHLVWARGSNQPFGGFDFNTFNSDLRSRVGADVVVTDYQLGKDGGFGGFAYPAAGSLEVLAQAPFPFLPDNAYYASVEEGRAELVAYLADRAATCPGEVFLLGGWSQGAQVIGEGMRGLAREVRDRIAYVALFGDPVLLTGNRLPSLPFLSSPLWPVSCALGPKPWIRGSSPCWISGGYLGPRDPYVPADMELRVGSWCTFLDGVCDGSFADLATAFFVPHVHDDYFNADSDSARAAQEAALALQIFLPAHAASFDVSMFQFVAGATGADIAFVFDTTGSMWDEIDAAKAQATQLAQEWLTFFPNGRVALVEYKDHGDSFVARVDLGLTNVVVDFQSAVNALSASGGGDYPEAVNSALMTALNGLDWRAGAIKTAIVIADAPGKDPEPITGFTRDQVTQRSLEIDPVAIYALNAAGFTDVTSWFAPLASATAGEVFVLQPGQTLADALFAVLETVHYSPVATLNGPYIAQTGTPIRFRTTGSFDADAALVSYEWDFNGDGTVDQTTTSPEVEYTYPGEFHGLAAVRVISSDGGSALATAQVTVDSVGLGDLLPLAPVSASASITGATEATVTWSPAANDRADGYRVYLADGTLVGFRLASDPHSLVVPGLDLSQPVVFQVVSSNGYGNSAAVGSAAVGGADMTAPVSAAGSLATTYTTTTVSIPFTASDTGGSGVASVELWARYRPNEAQPWGVWTHVAAGLTSPLTYTFASGDGNYEFYTVAVDGAGNREVAPATADAATRRDAADDPPAFSVNLTATATCTGICQTAVGDMDVVLSGTGTAVDDRSTVSVAWKLWGVKADGTRARLTNLRDARPLDGAFDSRIEGFEISDTRQNSGYEYYDVEIKVTTQGMTTVRTVRVKIIAGGPTV